MNEVIRCIECGAYRAAAVMGWNLAYDYMRTWILDNNKQSDQNKGLAKVCPGKSLITEYGDFFPRDAPSERHIIDAMFHKDAGPIIGGKLHDRLLQYLYDRNDYAHATGKAASAAKTNAYVEHLIDIILAVPFA